MWCRLQYPSLQTRNRYVQELPKDCNQDDRREKGAIMRLDGNLTIRRINVLKNHKCYIDERTNSCWKCRALARYRQDAEDRKARNAGGGRKHQRTRRS